MGSNRRPDPAVPGDHLRAVPAITFGPVAVPYDAGMPPEKVRLRIGNLAKAVRVSGQAYPPEDARNGFVSMPRTSTSRRNDGVIGSGCS